jgi:ABC-2 type transport system permease protein
MEVMMELAKRLSPTKWNYWRIVLALAAKDIVDAIKNKTTLTMLIGLGLMILTVQAMPLLLKFDDRPRVAIYDAARTSTADDLRRGRAVQVSEMRSAEEARMMAQEASGPVLAVTLPADLESSEGSLQIEGYLAHWIRPQTANELTVDAEKALAAVTGRPVDIKTVSVFPDLESRGHIIMVASGLVLATVLITGILVPYLILEEKTNHTLEVLQVSPASNNQLLMGKGIAGVVYGVLAAAALLAMNLAMVNQWSLMLLAVMAIILFGVGMGLLIGTMTNNEGTVQMWVGLLAILLLFPLMLGFVNSSRLPEWLQQVLAWLPTTAAFDLIRLSFTNVFPPAQVWPKVTALLISVVLVFGAAAWHLRRWEA